MIAPAFVVLLVISQIELAERQAFCFGVSSNFVAEVALHVVIAIALDFLLVISQVIVCFFFLYWCFRWFCFAIWKWSLAFVVSRLYLPTKFTGLKEVVAATREVGDEKFLISFNMCNLQGCDCVRYSFHYMVWNWLLLGLAYVTCNCFWCCVDTWKFSYRYKYLPIHCSHL